MRSALKLLVASVLLALLGAVFVGVAAPAGATTPPTLYVATTGNDTSNTCQTQSAPCATISHAVSVAVSGETIQVGAGTFNDNVTVPNTLTGLTIVGQGSTTIVTGVASGQSTFFLNGSATLKMLSISNNGSSVGIFDNADNSVFTQDQITNNSGGGIFDNGNGVSITQDTISGNGTGASGSGAIFNNGNSVTIADDTITGNAATGTGGALFNNGTSVSLVSDTINNNTAASGNGGIFNTAGLTVTATIIAGNTAPNCQGTVTDGGYNLEYVTGTPATPTCGFSAPSNDVMGNANPNLGLLAWNGGPTQTEAIGAGSPAQGVIPSANTACQGSDQRGTPRTQPGSIKCDLGAFQSIGGYWLVAGDGGIFSFGAPFYGSTGAIHLNQPIVGMAEDPLTGGYWFVASDGGVFAYNAPFYGSMGGKPLNKPIVGMAVDPVTGGYWLVASDGGIFSFNAPFYGSTGAIHLNQPIVGMAADPQTGGYWFVAADGGIFNYNAPFYGSMGSTPLNKPVVGMAADGATGGYWLVASDGGIFSFHAAFYGSTGAIRLNKPIVGMAASPSGQGYWFVAADGGVFSYNVPFLGSMGSVVLNQPVVGMTTG